MKNFLLVIFSILINALYMYVLFPIIFVGVMAWLWVPMFFEFEGAIVIGIVTTILTLVVTSIADYKLNSY